MKKLALLIGVGIGYVLGARAGRERYDEIAAQANKVWQNPKVQETVEDVKTNAPDLAHKASDSVKGAADTARGKVSNAVSDTESLDTDGTYENRTGLIDEGGDKAVDDTGFGPGGSKLP